MTTERIAELERMLAMKQDDWLAALRECERLEADIQEMVRLAADKHLSGYRELGATAARAENERDKALRRLATVTSERDRYREALRKTANGDCVGNPIIGCYDKDCLECTRDSAREALGEE